MDRVLSLLTWLNPVAGLVSHLTGGGDEGPDIDPNG